MARIDIQESNGRVENKSPSPARKVQGDKEAKTEPLNSDSGYFEGEDETLRREESVEIIFDKNASNNNLGADGKPNAGIYEMQIIILSVFNPVFKL